MRELTKNLFSLPWAMSLFGLEQMARMQKAMVDASFGLAGLGPSANGATGLTGSTAAGAADLLGQAGNLAFELLQLGIDTVYYATGASWSQQQGPPGWGPMPPPGTGSQQ